MQKAQHLAFKHVLTLVHFLGVKRGAELEIRGHPRKSSRRAQFRRFSPVVEGRNLLPNVRR